MKTQYYVWFHDDPRPTHNCKPVTRDRIAYLLRAARSRGVAIQIRPHAFTVGYGIGALEILPAAAIRNYKDAAFARIGGGV